MNEPQQQPDDQDARIEAALADLHTADSVNLAIAPPAALVRLIEQLRGSLSDMIRYNQEYRRRGRKRD